MKARYPITPKSGKRNTTADIHWCELDPYGKKYFLDGKKVSAREAVRIMRGFDNRAIVFFPELRLQVGKLIPPFLENGVLIGAGDVVRNLHYKEEGKTIYLSDASLFFVNPKLENMQALNEALFETMQVKMGATPGNTAMRIVRRFCGIKALWQPSDDIREVSRGSLTGGALHWQTGEYREAWKYDIHSAYAWAMKDIIIPLQPRLHEGMSNHSSDGMVFIATIDYETDKTFSPLTVYGFDEEAYHPTRAQNIKVALNHIDIQTLMNAGNLEIKKIHNTITWTQGTKLLEESMTRIDQLQTERKDIKPALKVIRNAIFGKFAEHDEMASLTLEPLGKTNKEVIDIIEAGSSLYMLTREEKYNPAPQHNPLFAGLITATIRDRIYKTIDENTVYVDTDGFISTQERAELETGETQGDWYLDERGKALVLGPRIYGLSGKTKIAGQHEYVSMNKLRMALENEIQVYESTITNPLLMDGQRDGSRTIKKIKYPHVEAVEDNLFVTRSPTVKIKSKLPDWI